jgi:hypothetical protein
MHTLEQEALFQIGFKNTDILSLKRLKSIGGERVKILELYLFQQKRNAKLILFGFSILLHHQHHVYFITDQTNST